MNRTKIEWCDYSWPIVNGCNRVSPGCGGPDGGGCYAERLAATRLRNHPKYEGLARMNRQGEPRWTGVVRPWPDALEEPLRVRKPSRIFVADMGDLFHEAVPDDFIDRVFAVMALCPQHTFQVLTKRPERMLSWASWDGRAAYVEGRAKRIARERGQPIPVGKYLKWPLAHTWLGVSVEDQARAEERGPLLLQTPAAVRFLSVEPLLGPVDLSSWLGGANEEVRRDRLAGGDEGRALDRRAGADLANRGAQGQPTHEGEPSRSVRPTTGGESTSDGVLAGSRDAPEEEIVRAGSPAGLASEARKHPGWADDQSQEWPEGRQPARQPRAGDLQRPGPARGQDAQGRSDREAARRSESRGDVDHGGGEGDPQAKIRRGEAGLDRDGLRHRLSDRLQDRARGPSLSWLIVGGESGPSARPCNVEWIRSIVEQGREAGVAVFVKQLGARPVGEFGVQDDGWAQHVKVVSRGDGLGDVRLRDSKGGDPREWPSDLCVREFPETTR